MIRDSVSVADQFQIGDDVLYVNQGIITTVVGYRWIEQVGVPPKVVMYRLACEISVLYDDLVRLTNGKIQMCDLDRTLANTKAANAGS